MKVLAFEVVAYMTIINTRFLRFGKLLVTWGARIGFTIRVNSASCGS